MFFTKARRSNYRAAALVVLIIVIVIASSRSRADSGTCGGQTTVLPFIDVGGSGFFCTIAAAYFAGLTNGTDATHYSPSANVTRDQMSAFITRTLDQAIKRSSPRIALNQSWNPQTANNVLSVSIGDQPQLVESDGEDVWAANHGAGTVSQVHSANGKLLGTWTGATGAFAVLCAIGKVFVTGDTNPGKLYRIDPRSSPGSVFTLSSNLGASPRGIAYDGRRIWTANFGGGSVSIITVDGSSVHTATTGFILPLGIVFDGSNIWVTDAGDRKLKKLDSSGNILMSVGVGNQPGWPVFDGMNIWVPNSQSDDVTVVRAIGGLAGTVLATLTGNGLSNPNQAAFDGERILITNSGGHDSVSLWKASDLTGIGSFQMEANSIPNGACSDGLNFWFTLAETDRLAKY